MRPEKKKGSWLNYLEFTQRPGIKGEGESRPLD